MKEKCTKFLALILSLCMCMNPVKVCANDNVQADIAVSEVDESKIEEQDVETEKTVMQNPEEKNLDEQSPEEENLDEQNSEEEKPENPNSEMNHLEQSQEDQNMQVQVLADEEPEEKQVQLRYKAHIQDIGWQDWKDNRQEAGTEGQSKRMEAIVLDFGDEELNAQIEYRAHVQNIGWQDWVHGGQQCGTTGQSLRVEAVQIRLTGELGEKFEIYYQVHIADFGTLDCVRDGECAGSEGFSKRMEAITISLVRKDDEEKPVVGEHGFHKAYTDNQLSYSAHVQNLGDVTAVTNGKVQGTTGQGLRMEGVTITLDTSESSVLEGSISYRTHIQNVGWQEWKENGEYSGTRGKSYRLEAIQIKLTGEVEKYYDIYYRAHVQNLGWMGWAKNGQSAGSQNCSYRMEAIQISLRLKEKAAPGNTEKAFYMGKTNSKVTISEALGVNPDTILGELITHGFDDYYLDTKYVGINFNRDYKECMRPKGVYGNNNSGMNCTGFVAFVFQKCGANLDKIGNMGLKGSCCNASNWLRYIKAYNVMYYQYSSVEELLSDGRAEKGDIIYCDPKNWNQAGADCHIGFFWGNGSSDNKFWHSSTKPTRGNQISAITPVTNPSYYYLIKLR